MKAIVQNSYGPPDQLAYTEIAPPDFGADDVLVRVHAAALHAGDYFCMVGVPYSVRMVVGFPSPKNYVPGFDVAGEVEAVGSNVETLRSGDRVFGVCKGACAEFARAKADELAPMPDNLDYREAAAIPTSGVAALRGLRDAGKVEAGQLVCINGASGGVGTYAIQIAKALGADVTAVCSTRNLELVRSIGADHTVDYTQEDFTNLGQQYDLILDNVANRTFAEYRRALKPDGVVLPNSGNAGLGYIVKAFLRSLVDGHQGRPFVATVRQDDLLYLRALCESEELTSVIDRTYPLEHTPLAMELIGSRHARGKVVINVVP